MCLVSIKLFIVLTILCATVKTCITYTVIITTITTINTCSFFLSAYNLFASNNTCSLDLFSGDHQTMTVLFTRNASSHKKDWMNFYFLSLALSCRFIVQDNQSNERSGSRRFVFRPSRELYCDYTVVCVHLVVCAFACLFIPLFLMLIVVGLLGTSSMHLSP